MTIAIGVLIIVLTFMGFMILRQGRGTVYPPTSNTCPDYWIEDISGMCHFPSDVNKPNGVSLIHAPLTSGPPYAVPSLKSSVASYYFNPQNPSWGGTGKTPVCAQREWALSQNIIWDGVTNYNSC